MNVRHCASPGSAGIPAGVEASAHKGWYSRGYIPHRDEAALTQSITFRLADSFPIEKLEQWRDWIDPETGEILSSDARIRARIEAWLDAGHGKCRLRDPRIAELVENALLHFDGDRYRLLAWCVMPNHVHVVAHFDQDHSLAEVVHSWKSFTASEANRILRRSGAFWFREYWDRFIRDERHLQNTLEYVEANPVKANLARSPEEWAWSSARKRLEEMNDESERI
jgi:REP element-mobilizing transposase RayT